MPTNIRVSGKVARGKGRVDVTTEVVDEAEAEEIPATPPKPEVEPVPAGRGGSFVKRGGKLYPRGS